MRVDARAGETPRQLGRRSWGRPLAIPGVPTVPPDGLDLMLACAVAGAVAEQVVAGAVPAPTARGGVAVLFLHTSGALVVALLTALLFRSAGSRRGWAAARFWIASFSAAAVAYCVWTAIYLVADGGWPRPLLGVLQLYLTDLTTGGARSQLPLSLVAVQVCLFLPLVRWLVRATRGRHAIVFACSLILQLALTAALHWRISISSSLPATLGWQVDHATAVLPTYQLFVVAGALLSVHREEAATWMRNHRGMTALLVLGGLSVAGAGYGFDVGVRHLAPLWASEEVQPAVDIAALSLLMLLLAVGLRWERRRRSWQRRLIWSWSAAASGVYLVSPLLLQAGLAVATAEGLSRLDRLPVPTAARATGAVGVGVVLVLVAAWALTAMLRRSVLNLPLTGLAPLPSQDQLTRPQSAIVGSIGTACVLCVLAVAVAGTLFPDALVPGTNGTAVDHPAPTVPAPEASPVATPPAPNTVATMDTVWVANVQRTYEVIRPANPGAARLPALVFLHGSKAPIAAEEQRDGLLTLASAGQAVLVYPVAASGLWNIGQLSGGSAQQEVDDVAFLARVVQQVQALPGIEGSQVSLLGYSDGGRMVYNVLCQQPRLVRSAVVIAALPPTQCGAGPPVSLLQVSADNDPVNPYHAVLDQVSSWLGRDDCGAAVATERAGTLALQRWSTCAQGTRVELATYAGAGHGPFGGNGSPTFEQVTWSFLQRTPLHVQSG